MRNVPTFKDFANESADDPREKAQNYLEAGPQASDREAKRFLSTAPGKKFVAACAGKDAHDAWMSLTPEDRSKLFESRVSERAYSTSAGLTEDDVIRMLKNKFPQADFDFSAPGELELLNGGHAEAQGIAQWLRGLDVDATAKNQFVEIPQLEESTKTTRTRSPRR